MLHCTLSSTGPHKNSIFSSKQRSRTSITQIFFCHYHNANGFIVHTHLTDLDNDFTYPDWLEVLCVIFSYQVRDWFEALRVLTRIFLPYGCRSCYNLWQKFPRTSSGCVIVEAFSESSQYDPFLALLAIWEKNAIWILFWPFPAESLSPLCSHLAPSLKIIIDCALFATVKGKIAF